MNPTYLNQVHEKREEMAKNILSIYSNKDILTTKEMSVETFQKSYPNEEFTVVTNDILKSYSESAVEKIRATKDITDREELIKSSAAEINSYEGVNVKAENGAMKKFYVKKIKGPSEKGMIQKSEDYSHFTSAQHSEKAQYHSNEAQKPENKNIRQWHLNRANEHAKLAKEKASK